MLDNTITLPVDVAHNSTDVDEIFTRDDEQTRDRTVYTGADNSLVSRNLLTFSRNRPTVSGNFRGVAKTTAKLTQDYIVEGVDTTTTNVAPFILAIGASMPVGVTAAEAMHMRQRAVALLDLEALIVKLMEELQI